MSNLFWFTDAQWGRIKPLLPTNTRGLTRLQLPIDVVIT